MNEAESLNRATNEKIVLCSYSTDWPTLFEEERARLLPLFNFHGI